MYMAFFNRESTPKNLEPVIFTVEEAALLSDKPKDHAKSKRRPEFFIDDLAINSVPYVSITTPENIADKIITGARIDEYFESPSYDSFSVAVGELADLHTLVSAKEIAAYTYIDERSRGVRKLTDAHIAIAKQLQDQDQPGAYDQVLQRLLATNAMKDSATIIKKFTLNNSVNHKKFSEETKRLYINKLAEETGRLRIGIEVLHADMTAQFGVSAIRAVSRKILKTLSEPDKASFYARLSLIDQAESARQARPEFTTHSPLSYAHAVDQRLAVVAATLDVLHKSYLSPQLGNDSNLHSQLRKATEIALQSRIDRSITSVRDLYSNNGIIESIPANPQLYVGKSLSLFVPLREEITLRTPAVLAADYELRRQQRTTKQKEQQAHETAEHEGFLADEEPIVASMNETVALQTELLAPFRDQTSRYLRSKGLIGPNSFDYDLRQSKLDTKQGYEPYIRLYDGLSQFVTVHDEYIEDFYKLNDQERALRGVYIEALHSRVFKSGLRPDTLQPDLSADLDWLRKNWKEFTSYIASSEHKNHVTAGTLVRIESLLFPEQGRDAEQEELLVEEGIKEETLEVIPEPAVIEWTEAELIELAEMDRTERELASMNHAELVKANELAEQLDWVVLPDQIITPDELVEIAERTLHSRGKQNSFVDRERMVNLLRFKDMYGGTLYRSAERMLGDSNNLYFVLKFTHTGDGNNYAIAENIVYGNATYVLREDILPLMDGETLLTAVKLSRGAIKDLGAKRLPHVKNASKTHPERITESIVDLSNAPSLNT